MRGLCVARYQVAMQGDGRKHEITKQVVRNANTRFTKVPFGWIALCVSGLILGTILSLGSWGGGSSVFVRSKMSP